MCAGDRRRHASLKRWGYVVEIMGDRVRMLWDAPYSSRDRDRPPAVVPARVLCDYVSA